MASHLARVSLSTAFRIKLKNPCEISRSCVLTSLNFHTGPKLEAGHNKWSNIKHIKAAKDKQKANITTKMLIRINLAIKEGGGVDPKLNRQLDRAIKEAEAVDVPRSTIQNALKRAGDKNKEDGKLMFFEIKGPGNCYVILEILTDKMARAKQHIHTVIKPMGLKLLESGKARHAFDYKGIVHVAYEGEADLDKALEQAIEAGAENVVTTTDSSDRNVYEFHCEDREIYKVTKYLESIGVNVTHSKREYVPKLHVTLNKDQFDVVSKLCSRLEDTLEDPILQIYDNIEVAD